MRCEMDWKSGLCMCDLEASSEESFSLNDCYNNSIDYVFMSFSIAISSESLTQKN